MLAVGTKAPTKSVVDQDGTEVSLKDLRGKWVVLYCYPRDNTPGCTTEAQGFRDAKAAFSRAGAVIVGVSKDTPASHQTFIEKQKLNFALWSDPDHVLMDAFGTWGERRFMGRTYMGTSRSTFLIDPDGKIAAVWEQVKPAGHAEDVLATLKKAAQKQA